MHGLDGAGLWRIANNVEGVPACKCGCGEPVGWVDWAKGYATFVIGHNANVETDDAKKARLEALRAAYASGTISAWSKGLTKETDERVRKRAAGTSIGRKKAFDEGRISAWSKGLTKETDERVKTLSESISLAHAEGRARAWAKGMTEADDPRILAKNEKLRERYRLGELRPWSKGLTAANDERLARWAERRREACASMGFEYPTRLSLEDVKERLLGLKQIQAVDPTFANYKNWQLRNLLFRCVDCDGISMESIQTAVTDRCAKCNPFSSHAQRQIYTYVRNTLNFTDAIINDRVIIKPYELDIVVPSAKLAIEFNGLHYHNVRYKAPDYHDKKSELVKLNKYKLLHIFEDEWRDKQEIVKSMIKHRLGINESLRGGARACTLVTLTPKERKAFFNVNHLDGDVSAIETGGLVDASGRVVAAASVRIPMHKSVYDDHLELARFATVNDLCVPGALGKLTSWARKTATKFGKGKVLTYADGRVGHGDAYKTAGWRFLRNTAVRWWWTDNHTRFNRFKVRADAQESERDKAERLNLQKIYGCRNAVYELDAQ